MMEAFALIPWLLIVGFWAFVIWAVLALIGVLREVVAELRGINERLRTFGDQGTAGSSRA